MNQDPSIARDKKLQRIISLLKLLSTIDDIEIIQSALESIVEMLEEDSTVDKS